MCVHANCNCKILTAALMLQTAGAAHHDFLQLLCIRVVAAVAAIRIVQDPRRLVCGGALGQPPHLCRLQLGTRRLVQFLPETTLLGQ
jgi:hypothetical protein